MAKCEKQSFDTAADARYAMSKVPVRQSGKVPVKTYWCKTHKAFHYTSKPQMKGRR